jgi:ubiquinone/menaquinone biosynthesis C-methylase UbiE
VNEALKDEVRTHWERDPCGARHSTAAPGTAEFYEQTERKRYILEPFIPTFAEFERWRSKDVLEVGIGIGADFMRFARAGARLHGVDLTQAAVDLVDRRLELEGRSADIRRADAESLPFPDMSFDLVYSWGVLHHTPDTARAIGEVRRVLRPGGEARIMLYSRHSWVALGTWLRHGLAACRPWRSLSHVLGEHMESAGTKAFTQRELDELFLAFSDVRYTHFVTPYDRRVAGPLARVGGDRFGWFVGITARRGG